jgi:hypothetical protein
VLFRSNNIVAVGQAIFTTDDNYWTATTNKAFISWSADGGQTWDNNEIPLGNRPLINSISVPNQNVCYVGSVIDYKTAKVLKTVDRGKTWVDISPPFDTSFAYVNLVHFYNSDIGIVSADPSNYEFKVYLTINGGTSWTTVPDEDMPNLLYSDEFSTGGDVIGDNIWFCTSYGRIYKSKNRGKDWEVYQSALQYLEGISFSDSLNGIATFGFVDKNFLPVPMEITYDGGISWKTMDISPLGDSAAVLGYEYITNSTYIMLTTCTGSLLTGDFATWISPDRGETWQQISSGENIFTLNFLDASTGWGGEGQQLAHPTRMFQYTGSPLMGLFSYKALQVDWDVFPNPTADRVQIRLKDEKPASYLLLINDLQGKLILRKDWDGVDTLDLDLGACASGMYTVTLACKEGKAVRKLVVAR